MKKEGWNEEGRKEGRKEGKKAGRIRKRRIGRKGNRRKRTEEGNSIIERREGMEKKVSK